MRTILRDDWPTKTLNSPWGTIQACLTTSLRTVRNQHDLRRRLSEERTHHIEMAFLLSLTTTLAFAPFLRNVRSNPAILFNFLPRA